MEKELQVTKKLKVPKPKRHCITITRLRSRFVFWSFNLWQRSNSYFSKGQTIPIWAKLKDICSVLSHSQTLGHKTANNSSSLMLFFSGELSFLFAVMNCYNWAEFYWSRVSFLEQKREMEIYFDLKRWLQQNKYTSNITRTFWVCRKTYIQLILFSVSFFKERHLIFIADICWHRRSAGRYYNEVFFVYRKKLCSWFFNNVWQSHRKEMEVSTGIVVCHVPEAWCWFILFPSWADFIWTNNWKFSYIFCCDSAVNEVLMNELHFSENALLS